MKSITFEKPCDIQILQRFIYRQFPLLPNGFWELSFGKPNRTMLENRTFWGWMRLISEETGNDQQSLYRYYTEKFNPAGCTYFKDGLFASGGTSKLNTKQFAQLLTEIQSDVNAELGIILPTSKDAGFDEFYKNYC
jgi:hypothetical protein